MTDSYRRKSYYSPRVLLDTSECASPPWGSLLLCLSPSEIYILRNLLQYSTRRANWVQERHEQYYLTPDVATWDSMQAIVAELENKLMTGCEDIEGILNDILAAVACICPNLAALQARGVVTPDSMGADGVSTYIDYGDSMPSVTVPGQGSSDACAIAQLWYQAGYELITERVIPASRAAFEVLLPAAAAAIAVMTGGTALPVLLGAFAVSEVVELLFEYAWDSAESNLVNWMLAQKQDIICEMFDQLIAGGTTASMWAAVYDAEIAPSEEISVGDKAILGLFMGPLACTIAKTAHTEASDWATDNVTAGYCDACPDDVIVGSNWVAVPVPFEYGFVDFYRADGTTELRNCMPFYAPAGRVCCGAVFQVQKHDGTGGDVKRMDTTVTCNWYTCLWPNTSEDLAVGMYDSIVGTNINLTECRAALNPTGTHLSSHNRVTGGAWHIADIHIGGYPAGMLDVELRYRWLVFEGTTVPTVLWT